MMKSKTIFLVSAGFVIAACGQQADVQAANDSAATAQATETSIVRDDAAQAEFEAPTGVYEPDYKHRYITFSYLHKGYSRPWVRWDSWDGELNWNAENPESSSVEITIDVASVDSGVEEFDGHLLGERFFDVENHPEITFVSTDVSRSSETEGVVTGDLTIKGNTHPVSLDVVYNKSAFEERGNKYVIGFSGTTTVKRSDFGVDFLTPAVSDEVDIVIEAEFEMPAAAE